MIKVIQQEHEQHFLPKQIGDVLVVSDERAHVVKTIPHERFSHRTAKQIAHNPDPRTCCEGCARREDM